MNGIWRGHHGILGFELEAEFLRCAVQILLEVLEQLFTSACFGLYTFLGLNHLHLYLETSGKLRCKIPVPNSGCHQKFNYVNVQGKSNNIIEQLLLCAKVASSCIGMRLFGKSFWNTGPFVCQVSSKAFGLHVNGEQMHELMKLYDPRGVFVHHSNCRFLNHVREINLFLTFCCIWTWNLFLRPQTTTIPVQLVKWSSFWSPCGKVE